MIDYENPWTYDKQEVGWETLEPFYGFVYELRDQVTGKRYIGRKQLWNYRKQKDSKRRKKTESDWRDYYSSHAEIKELAKDQPFRFRRKIIHLCKSKGEMNFLEIEEQFKRGVLYGDEYYNDNINRQMVQEECQQIHAWLELLRMS